MEVFATVPKLWPGGTVAVIASGPSLTQEDVDFVRGKVDGTIVVNASYPRVMWADCLYGCDGGKFWTWHKGVPEFTGLKYALTPNKFGIPVLRNTGREGLELDPSGLKTGQNSGYQAINLAVHFGASRIVLLGLDMKLGPGGKRHWHEDHENQSAPPFELCKPLFPTIVEPLKAIGVRVINCSRETALTCFPRVPLDVELKERAA